MVYNIELQFDGVVDEFRQTTADTIRYILESSCSDILSKIKKIIIPYDVIEEINKYQKSDYEGPLFNQLGGKVIFEDDGAVIFLSKSIFTFGFITEDTFKRIKELVPENNVLTPELAKSNLQLQLNSFIHEIEHVRNKDKYTEFFSLSKTYGMYRSLIDWTFDEYYAYKNAFKEYPTEYIQSNVNQFNSICSIEKRKIMKKLNKTFDAGEWEKFGKTANNYLVEICRFVASVFGEIHAAQEISNSEIDDIDTSAIPFTKKLRNIITPTVIILRNYEIGKEKECCEVIFNMIKKLMEYINYYIFEMPDGRYNITRLKSNPHLR